MQVERLREFQDIIIVFLWGPVFQVNKRDFKPKALISSLEVHVYYNLSECALTCSEHMRFESRADAENQLNYIGFSTIMTTKIYSRLRDGF